MNIFLYFKILYVVVALLCFSFGVFAVIDLKKKGRYERFKSHFKKFGVPFEFMLAANLATVVWAFIDISEIEISDLVITPFLAFFAWKIVRDYFNEARSVSREHASGDQ